jgi:hypothetical protein
MYETGGQVATQVSVISL